MTTDGSIGPIDGIRRIALPLPRSPLTGARRALAGAFGVAGLVPFALLGHASGLPGLQVRLRIAALGSRLALRRRRVRSTRIYEMFCFPMDSTRYFEFDFMWRHLKDVSKASYLDVSSPRLLPILFVDARPDVVATLINPDAADLRETRDLAEACGIAGRCSFEERVVGELSIPDESFDVITSVSVVEHIRDDVGAVAQMWRTLRPGGRLLLSMPCAANAEQQFINRQNYSFIAPEADGTIFHQYVYNSHSLQRFFAVTGAPVRQEIYGERKTGFHRRLYERKWTDASYPFWKEPWFMTAFSRFDSIEQLPGEGVVLLEFVK